MVNIRELKKAGVNKLFDVKNKEVEAYIENSLVSALGCSQMIESNDYLEVEKALKLHLGVPLTEFVGLIDENTGYFEAHKYCMLSKLNDEELSDALSVLISADLVQIAKETGYKVKSFSGLNKSLRR